MYPEIQDHGLIGDCRSAALVTREATIDWLCWPRFDSPALFLAILDDARGGACTVEAEGMRPGPRRYLPGTNILETRLEAAGGAVTVTDFMPVRHRSPGPEGGPDMEAEGRVVRLLRGVEGGVSLTLRVRPTFDWARPSPRVAYVGADGVARLRERNAAVSVSASHPLVIEDGGAVLRLRLEAGQTGHLAIAWGERPALSPQDVAERFEETQRYWEGWSGACTYDGPFRDEAIRSALCLKLLTHTPSGGIVAAPTTSLTERLGSPRTWDYRYAWLRDASFCVDAFLRVGHAGEPAAFLGFAHRAKGDDPKLRVLYPLEGDMPKQRKLKHLQGWHGTGPVRVGNGAVKQIQYAIYGELLSALHRFLEDAGQEALPRGLRESLPHLVTQLAEFIIRHWRKRDRGIWELRNGPFQLVHSKAMCWVALDRAIRLASMLGIQADLARWARVRDAIRAEYEARGWDESRGAYVQAYGRPVLDASVLRAVLFDAFDPRSERITSTMAAIERELGEDGLVYRYRAPDGVHGAECTFAACSLWLAATYALRGETREAESRFRHILSFRNDLGLFSEEIEAHTGALRGNFPQAFTHTSLINGLGKLQDAVAQFGWR